MSPRALKALVPWWVRIPAKVALSRLPVSRGAWRRLRLFQHGSMHRGAYVRFVFERHLAELTRPAGFAGKVLLELGPGDGVASGLFASCLGAERTILVDAGDFASRDRATYLPMIAAWKAEGLSVEHLERAETFDALCAAGRTTYLTGGLASLRTLPSASVDVEFSNAVLEHVRVHELDAVLVELRRVLRPHGFARHAIDLRDHLGGRLSNLRFDAARWESPLFAESGFYTNRVRYRDMVARMRRAGFAARVPRTWEWDALPTPRGKLAPEFRGLSDDELRVWGFDAELVPEPVAAPPEPGPAAALPSRRADASHLIGTDQGGAAMDAIPRFLPAP